MEGRKGSRPLRLAGDARFERYGQTVYLRTIGSRKDYLFNAVSYDVLRRFDGGAARTREGVFAALSGQFEVKDMAAFRREVGGFLDTLEREGIMNQKNKTSTVGSGKQAYQMPAMLASQVRSASGNVCGWYTQCGKQVKCRS